MTHWTGGLIFTVGFWTTSAVMMLGWLLVFPLLIRRDNRRDPADPTPWPITVLFTVGPPLAFVIVMGALSAILYWPFGAEYHHWTRVTGTVAESVPRMLSDGDGTTQQFPVKFTDGRIRRCDDSRCALLHPGDTLTLWCVRDYQFDSTPGWKCKYGGTQ